MIKYTLSGSFFVKLWNFWQWSIKSLKICICFDSVQWEPLCIAQIPFRSYFSSCYQLMVLSSQPPLDISLSWRHLPFRCMTLDQSTWNDWVMQKYKGLALSLHIGDLVRAISALELPMRSTETLLKFYHTWTSLSAQSCFLLFSSLPEVLTLRILPNKLPHVNLHLRVCFLENTQCNTQ